MSDDNLIFIPNKYLGNPPPTNFYQRQEWFAIRYLVMQRDRFECVACGKSKKHGVKIHVDHIKPLSIYPEMALSMINLQTMCNTCNEGKSNVHQDDLRHNSIVAPQPIRIANNGKLKVEKLVASLKRCDFGARVSQFIIDIKDRPYESLSDKQKRFIDSIYEEWEAEIDA